MRWLAGSDNLKGKGFDNRSTGELREIQSRGGKASGEARRKKADFRKTLNALLTAKIDSPEWTPMLEAMGVESTLESAVNAAMIKEALSGNVKAFEAIARYSGQSDRSDADQEEQKARTEQIKANTERMHRETGSEAEDGVEIINDAPKETD